MKKTLLLTMLLALLLPWAINAEELTLFEGTNTESHVPFNGLYADYGTRSQFIIPADELGEMNGGVISKLTFYCQSTSLAYDEGVTVYLKEVDNSTFSSAAMVNWSDMVVAYVGTIGVSEGLMEIELSSPYTYNGENLLIGFQVTQWGSDCPSSTWYGMNQTSTTALYENASSSSHSWSGTISSVSFLPKVTFEYTPGEGGIVCEKPSVIEISEITTQGASIAWADGSGVYNLEYKKSSDTLWTALLSGTGDFSVDIDNLTPYTAYQVRVQSVCDEGTSGWRSANFKTLAGVPFMETFDASSIPAGWSLASGSLDAVMDGTDTLTSATYGWSFGEKNVFDSHAYCNIYSTGCYKWLLTPEIYVEENCQLSFDLALTLWSSRMQVDQSKQQDDKFIVLASNDGGENWEILRQWDNQGSEDVYNLISYDINGQSVVIDLASYAEQSVIFAFYGESTVSGGDNALHIDNVSVDNVPLCEKPINFAVVEGSVSTNSVELEWQDDMAGTWLLQYKRSADEQWTALAEQVTENPFVLEGLAPASIYQVRIAAWCDPSDSATISQFCNAITFVTECGAVDIAENAPYVENFDTYTAVTSTSASSSYPNDVLPNCWQFLNRSSSTSSYPQAFLSSNSGYIVSGNCLFFKSSQTTPIYAILPEFGTPISGLQLNFTYRNEGVSGSNGTLHVGYMTDPADESSYTEVAAFARTTTLTEEEVFFAGAPDGSFIAFKYVGGTADNYYLGLDNVSVSLLPSCVKPMGLAVVDGSIQTTQVELEWVASGDESAWKLQYKKSTDSVWVALEDAVTAVPYVLNGLDPSSVYQVRVAAWCDPADDNEVSEFSSPLTFATDCEALTVDAENPFIENFDAYVVASASTPSARTLPICWNYINDCSYSSYALYPTIYYYSYTDYSHSTDNSLRLYSLYSSYSDYDPQPQYAVLPLISDIDDLQLTLWARGYTASSELKVGRMSDPADASTFQLIATQVLSTSYQEFTYNLSGAEGDYIALMIDAANSDRTTNGVYIDDISVHVIPACPKPSELAVSDITAHTATLSWLPGNEETAWQILLNGDSIIDADSNPFILTGLDSETIYSAKVRANCGEEVSEWANDSVRFTTLVACPVPDFRADSIKNIGAHSVDLAWGGDAESYTISYRTAAGATGIGEGFEGGLGGWTLRDCNSDTDISSSDAHSGSNSFRFHYSYYPPQYLISPVMSATAENEVLSFYYKAESLTYPESFKVGYSSTDNATGSFTFGDEYITSDTLWHQFSEAVPAGTKFICIQYTAYDKYYLYIDDILIGEEIPAGEWVVSDNVEGNSLVLSDLQAETAYEVKIQANCGEEGVSGESAVISFRTLSDCETPKNFQLLALATDSAVISWSTFEQEVFNFRYHADGEEWIEVSGVTCPYTMTGLSAGTTYTLQVQAACNTEVWSDSVYFKTVYSVPFAPGEISSTVLEEEWIKASGLASDIFAGGQLQSSTSGWISSNANTLFDEAHLKLNNYGQNRYYWIISPAIDLSDVTLAADEKLKLAFTMARAKYSSSGDLAGLPDSTGLDDKFMVVFSTDNGATWSEANATIWSNEAGNPNIYNAIPNTGVDILLDFSAAAGHVMRFAFYGESVSSDADNDIHVGNILLDIVGNTTGVDAVMEEGKAMKFFLDGHIYIRMNGKTFDTTGRLVK